MTSSPPTASWKSRNEDLLFALDQLLQFKSTSDIKLATYQHHLHALKTIYATNLTTSLFRLKLKIEGQSSKAKNTSPTKLRSPTPSTFDFIPPLPLSFPQGTRESLKNEEQEEQEEEKEDKEEDMMQVFDVSQTELDMSDTATQDSPMLMGTLKFNSQEFLHLQDRLSKAIKLGVSKQKEKEEETKKQSPF